MEKAKEQPKQPHKVETAKEELLAAVRIRGATGLTEEIISTLNMLSLFRKNSCVVINNVPSLAGMLNRCKDYITWGEIDHDTLKLLIEKRAEKNPEDPKKTKKFFRLNNPIGGFERKGVKKSFVNGGALGYRGKEINKLIKKMIH